MVGRHGRGSRGSRSRGKAGTVPVARPSRERVGRPPGSGKAMGRPPKPKCPVSDREGNPDVYKIALRKLRKRGVLDERIKEPECMDWRAEKTQLEEHIERVRIQQSYIPRLGEIVLWTPALEGGLRENPKTKAIEAYSGERFLSIPEWRAGIVAQVPREDIKLRDIVETSDKSMDVNYSGFRIETFPDTLSSDKSYSLHYKYVPLKCIKPFNSFEVFLQQIPREQFHPSIEYAMTVMSSISLLNKTRIRGTSPDASILSQAMYLGAELLVIGDAVRLKPKGSTAENCSSNMITDVLVIEEIRVDLSSCDDDYQSERLAENYRFRIRGKAYTNSPYRVYTIGGNPPAMSHDEVVGAFQYTGMGGYGDWYGLHRGKTVEVSQDMIIGRCYEPDAMAILFGSLSISRDLHGVLIGRDYSRQTDERIAEGKHWFWGDYRTQTLALDTLNGEDVGPYNEARDIGKWKANLHIIDGQATAADVRKAKPPGKLGRPSKNAKAFGDFSKTSTLVSTGLGVDGSNNVSSSSEDEGSGSESEEEDFTTQLPVRGGTEETEEGDYHPGRERDGKRPKYG